MRIKPLDRSWWQQLGITLGLIATAAFLGFLFHLVLPSLAHAADQGYFNCFRLTDDQRSWFRQPGISHCCDLTDGMPVRFEDRPEGTFVPPYGAARVEAEACRDAPDVLWGDGPLGEDRATWIKVPDAQVLRKNNPIGVGVIWWVNSGEDDREIRCFVGLPRA